MKGRVDPFDGENYCEKKKNIYYPNDINADE